MSAHQECGSGIVLAPGSILMRVHAFRSPCLTSYIVACLRK